MTPTPADPLGALFLAIPCGMTLAGGVAVLVGLWSPQAGAGIGLLLLAPITAGCCALLARRVRL